MSDLTREEIRRACEAVGWEEEDCSGRPVWRDAAGFLRFHPFAATLTASEAIALLEATGEGYRIDRFSTGEDKGFLVQLWECPNEDPLCDEVQAPDLPTAAVRAVNAWAERKETP